MKIPIGVITKKKTTPITIGEIIDPKNKPNLNHILFRGVKIFELIKPRIKKIIEIERDQILIIPPSNKGHMAISKNTMKKTKPKFRFEPIWILES
tara:strand:+ start:4249 stop:4533 length:285 start_codon:yes stop_codon:yes gene_type:complete